MKHKRYFNMIEIAIAMAVAGAGITLILALFPMAVRSAQDTIDDSYIPMIASTFVTQINAIADAQTKPFNDSNNWFHKLKSSPEIPAMSLNMNSSSNKYLDPDSGNATYLGSESKRKDEAMSLYSYKDGDNVDGFIVVFKSYNADSQEYDIVDFTAAITLDKELVSTSSSLQNEFYVFNGSTKKAIFEDNATPKGKEVMDPYFMRLKLTIQWPLETPPDGRKKRTYIIEKAYTGKQKSSESGE